MIGFDSDIRHVNIFLKTFPTRSRTITGCLVCHEVKILSFSNRKELNHVHMIYIYLSNSAWLINIIYKRIRNEKHDVPTDILL